MVTLFWPKLNGPLTSQIPLFDENWRKNHFYKANLVKKLTFQPKNVKSDPSKMTPPSKKLTPGCVCMYIYIYKVSEKHPPQIFLQGLKFSGFWVRVFRFPGCRFQISRMPISDFWDADFLIPNATLFLKKKDTLFVEISRASFSPPQFTFLCQCFLFFMPNYLFSFFRDAVFNAGLSPCSHTTTTTEYVWILTPGRVFKTYRA